MGPLRVAPERVRVDADGCSDVSRALARVLHHVTRGLSREAEPLDVRGRARRADVEAPPADHLLERFRERGRRRVALRGILRERAEQHRADVVGDAAGVAVDGAHVRVADAEQHVELAPAGEERAHRHHLREDDGEREEIAPRVELAPHDLLGRHVAKLSFELTDVGATLELRGARDAEVRQLDRAGTVDEQVSRRHVPVNERQRLALVARGVGVLEPAQHAERDVERDLERDVLAARRRGPDQTRAGRPVDVLHGHVELAVLLAEVEDRHDVRVGEASRDAGLVDEHRDELGVARELRQDALDGHLLGEPVRPGALGEVHLRHPASGEPLDELVRAEPRGGFAAHVVAERITHPSADLTVPAMVECAHAWLASEATQTARGTKEARRARARDDRHVVVHRSEPPRLARRGSGDRPRPRHRREAAGVDNPKTRLYDVYHTQPAAEARLAEILRRRGCERHARPPRVPLVALARDGLRA